LRDFTFPVTEVIGVVHRPLDLAGSGSPPDVGGGGDHVTIVSNPNWIGSATRRQQQGDENCVSHVKPQFALRLARDVQPPDEAVDLVPSLPGHQDLAILDFLGQQVEMPLLTVNHDDQSRHIGWDVKAAGPTMDFIESNARKLELLTHVSRDLELAFFERR
jgi:hypothetical protein